MKVKRVPEDFVVHEVTRLPMAAGEHAVYRLEKIGLGTPEAVREIISTWNLSQGQVRVAGQKDRHAQTSQTMTIHRGPAQDLVAPRLRLTYLGTSPQAIAPQHIVANEFQLTLRRLPPEQAAALQSELRSTLVVPNYFDDQRFGSVGLSGRFVAHPWCLGDYEQALFLAIAEENPWDRPHDRQQKRLLREHWGDWSACKAHLDRSHRRSIVTYLVDHPSGFKKAVGLIRRDLRSLYVAALQSKIWNEMVSRKIERHFAADDIVRLDSRVGAWCVPRRWSEQQRRQFDTGVPLPSGRKTDWNGEDRRLLEEVVAEFGMQPHQLRFSYPRDVFFARGVRRQLLVANDVLCEVSQDEFSGENWRKIVLQFQLKAGQYATMLIKGIQVAAGLAVSAGKVAGKVAEG